MIQAKNFLDEFIKKDISFFAGVPDSVLKSFISYLTLIKKKKYNT